MARGFLCLSGRGCLATALWVAGAAVSYAVVNRGDAWLESRSVAVAAASAPGGDSLVLGWDGTGQAPEWLQLVPAGQGLRDYRAPFAIRNALGQVFSWGEARLTLEIGDTQVDSFGFPRPLRLSEAASLTVTGVLVEEGNDFDGMPKVIPLSGQLSRSAGSVEGRLLVSLGAVYPWVSLDTAWRVQGYAGTYSYDTAGAAFSLESLTGYGGPAMPAPGPWSGEAAFGRAGASLALEPFWLLHGGQRLHVAGATLEADESRIAGFVEAVGDAGGGEAFLLRLQDAHDANGDGVPDLAGPPALPEAPVLIGSAGEPPEMRVRAGGLLILRVSATGEGLSWRWFQDDGLLPGETGETLVLGPALTGMAGRYTAEVRNAAGVDTRAVAIVSVDPPEIRASVEPHPGGWLVEWNTVPGARYQLYRSGNLQAWAPLGPESEGDGQRAQFADTDSLPDGGYYRVEVRY